MTEPRPLFPRPPRGGLTRILVFVSLAGLLWIFGPFILEIFRAARSETRFYEVRGQVIDDTSHVAIRGARVILHSSWGFNIHFNPMMPVFYADTVMTDDQGEFRFRTRLAGSTSFTATRAGYLMSSASADPRKHVRIPMLAIRDDHGRKRKLDGFLPVRGLANPFSMDLEHGIMAPNASIYDVRVYWGPSPDSTIKIAAAPGRGIQWRPLRPSTNFWFQGPVNVCEAPEDGYVDTLTIRWDAEDGACFVRRDDGPYYGAFGVHPLGLFEGPTGTTWRNRFGLVFNRDGGRSLCDEKSIVFLR